jgi:hypothetical protein
MEHQESASEPLAHAELVLELERQLHIAEKHFASARDSADHAREELRALTVQLVPRAESIKAARARFEAIAARCGRLLAVMDVLEERLDALWVRGSDAKHSLALSRADPFS